ncbi:MAG TPA: cytochrome b/b6 domain-containing protein [Actinomycetota bacterium]|nr:cytochrome b/b6 domain-containing protein [Actinomycetota bacterium]
MAGLQRYGRRTRWFHAGVYVFTLVALGTGLWINFGQEGRASFLARLLNRPDIVIHEDAGWVLVGLAAIAVIFGFRAIATFAEESFRYGRGDGAWLAGWPKAAFTGRFRRHGGHFDPGQRIANIVIAVGILTLIASGVALLHVHGGPWFVRLAQIHQWTTYILIPVIAGHIIVASGVLPGYRGVWRSMHWGGRVRPDTAERLWPDWAEKQTPGLAPAPDPEPDLVTREGRR